MKDLKATGNTKQVISEGNTFRPKVFIGNLVRKKLFKGETQALHIKEKEFMLKG